MLLPFGSSTKAPDVARVVVRPLTRRAVVGEARADGGLVEGRDGRVVRGGEREMHVLGRLALDVRECRVRADVLDPVGRVVLQADPDQRRHGLPEAALGRDVARAKPEVVDPAGAARRGLVHGLDAVAVGIAHEGAVVVLAVVRPRPRLAVALVAGAGQPLPPRIHVGAARRAEADVQVARDRVSSIEPELVPLDVLA